MERLKGSQYTLVPIPELEEAELLYYGGKFDAALKEIKKVEKKGGIDETDLVRASILESRIITKQGRKDDGLHLGELAIEKSQRYENPLILLDAIIAKTMTLLEIGTNLKDCQTTIDQGLEILKAGRIKKEDYLKRKLELIYLQGKLYRKKGDLKLALEKIYECLSLYKDVEDSVDLAEPLNELGVIYASKGEFGSALEYLERSLKIFEDLENTSFIIKILNNIGYCQWQKGDFDQALDYYNRSLTISEELGFKQFSAALLLNIGLIFKHKGEFDQALEYFKRSLKIFEELNNVPSIATCLNNIGIISQEKGELDEALKYYNKSLEKFEELENKQEIAASFNNIGALLEVRGDYVDAATYYMKGLLLFEEIGNNTDTSGVLYNLVRSSVHERAEDQANVYLQKLESINAMEENKLIDQRYRLAKALLLKMSTRVVSQAKAQEILKEIIDEEIIKHDLTVEAMLNLFEILLHELRTTGRQDVLTEVKQLSQDLLGIALSQNSFTRLAEIYRLQAKLALLELDVKASQQLLTQAQLISETKGLHKLARAISFEHDNLLNQMSIWDDYIDRQASIVERFELAELETMMGALLRKKISVTEDLPEEEPLMLLILDDGGVSLFSKKFASAEQLQEQLIGGFLTAINAFMQEAFSVSGSIERIKHKEYTLLLKTLDPLLFCYIFQGQSYTAIQKLDRFVDNVQDSQQLRNAILNIRTKGRPKTIMKTIEEAIIEIFS